jgi:CO/xanthine dehydrogenase FAD-binding subunit
MRVPLAEDLLVGQRVTSELIAEAAQAVSENAEPAADIDGSQSYKRRVLGVLARRALTDALTRADNRAGA